MHEMSIAMAVVGQVQEAAELNGGVTSVTSVRLQVGELMRRRPGRAVLLLRTRLRRDPPGGGRAGHRVRARPGTLLTLCRRMGGGHAAATLLSALR